MARTPAAPLTRGHKKKQRTRRQLIDAAIEVIAERGEAFSASDIATRAGVSNGTFYNYFDDRDALIDAVVDDLVAGFAAQSDAIVGHDDPVLRFATISALALRSAATSPDGASVVLRLDAVQRALLDGDALAHLRDDVRAAHDRGSFTSPPDDATIDVVVGALLLAARRAARHGSDRVYDRRVVAQLLRSVGFATDRADDVAAEAVHDAAALRPTS